MFTVEETAFILGENCQRVYYLVRMCMIDAFKVGGSVRIPQDSLEDYDKRRIQETSGANVLLNNERSRFDERIKAVSAFGVPSAGARSAAFLESGRRTVCGQGGLNKVPGQKRKRIDFQLKLFPEYFN